MLLPISAGNDDEGLTVRMYMLWLCIVRRPDRPACSINPGWSWDTSCEVNCKLNKTQKLTRFAGHYVGKYENQFVTYHKSSTSEPYCDLVHLFLWELRFVVVHQYLSALDPKHGRRNSGGVCSTLLRLGTILNSLVSKTLFHPTWYPAPNLFWGTKTTQGMSNTMGIFRVLGTVSCNGSCLRLWGNRTGFSKILRSVKNQRVLHVGVFKKLSFSVLKGILMITFSSSLKALVKSQWVSRRLSKIRSIKSCSEICFSVLSIWSPIGRQRGDRFQSSHHEKDPLWWI